MLSVCIRTGWRSHLISRQALTRNSSLTAHHLLPNLRSRALATNNTMADEGINTDLSARACERTAEMQWTPSPSGTVWRKRCEIMRNVLPMRGMLLSSSPFCFDFRIERAHRRDNWERSPSGVSLSLEVCGLGHQQTDTQRAAQVHGVSRFNHKTTLCLFLSCAEE